MSLNLGVLSAAVTLSDAQYVNTLDNLEKKSDDTFKKISDAVTNYLTVNALVDFGKKAIQTFSDLEEATNKFNVVFAGFTDKAGASVDELIKKFGQSELSAKQMLSGTGDILTGFGFDRKAALDMSVLAAKLGADLASFSNYAGGAKGASEALTKAMLGETEMAKMLGIVIRQDSDEFKQLAKQAMETGLDVDKSGNTIKVNTEQQAKALAALALAYQQSPNAIGDFERSQDSIANQTQILNNRLTDLYKTIGQDGASFYSDALQGINSLLAGYVNLDAGVRSLINNAAILTGAFVLLNKTGVLRMTNLLLNSVVATFRYVNALGTLKLSMWGATLQQETFAMSMQKTKAIAGGMSSALAGAAIAWTVSNMMIEKEKAQLQDRVDLSREYVDKVNKEAQVLKERHQSEQDQLSRLEELSKYERLNNSEKQEAEKLIKQLNGAYGNLGISIDSISGKLHMNAGAWEKLSDVQREQALIAAHRQLNANKRLAKDMARASWHDITGGYAGKFKNLATSLPQIMEMQNTDKAIAELERLRAKVSDAGNAKGAKAINELIKSLEQRKQLEQQILEIQNSSKDAAKRAAEQRKKNLQQQTEEERKELLKLSTVEWQIEFNSADTEKKARMIGLKIEKIFAEYKRAGKYNTLDEFLNADDDQRNAKELKHLQEILKLIDEENNLIKQGADEAERKRKAQEKEIADARRRKEEIVEQNRDFIAEQAAQQIEIQLKNLQVSGDTAGYNALVQQELAKATQAAAKAQQEYMSAFAKIKNEQTVDKDTEEQLRKLLRTAQDAQQKQRAWDGKLNTDENADVQQEQTRKVVGAWSLAEFSRQQENSVESRIEKNTRETARLLKNSKGLVY